MSVVNVLVGPRAWLLVMSMMGSLLLFGSVAWSGNVEIIDTVTGNVRQISDEFIDPFDLYLNGNSGTTTAPVYGIDYASGRCAGCKYGEVIKDSPLDNAQSWKEESPNIIEALNRGVLRSGSFSLSTAVELAALSNLSYFNDAQVKATLNRYGYDQIFYRTNDNQFFLARESGSSGQKKYIIAIRGTNDPGDLGSDASVALIPGKYKGKAHAGFSSLARAVLNDLPEKIVRELKGGTAKLYVAGHSLGGAASVILSASLVEAGVPNDQITVYTYGAPAVGDYAFAAEYKSKLEVYRVWNAADPVPKILHAADIVLPNHVVSNVISKVRAGEKNKQAVAVFQHVGTSIEIHANGHSISKQYLPALMSASPVREKKKTIVAIVDSSGSMSQTDQNNLRVEALRMMLDSLGDATSLGVVDFSDSARAISKPLRLGRFGSDNRELIRSKLGAISSSGGTDIQAGLRAAASMGFDKDSVWVLLTDGQDNRWGGEADLVPSGVVVHSIALSQQADREGLSRISRETGGISEIASSANDLPRIISNLFGSSEGVENVYIQDGVIRLGESITCDVMIEPGQLQTEFRVNWPGSDVDISLTDPNGNSVTINQAKQAGYGVEAPTYDIIRVENPQAGKWKVELIGVKVAQSGEPYSLRVSAKESKVKTKWDTSAPVPEIGQPFSITLDSEDSVSWERAEVKLWTPDGKTKNSTVSLNGLEAMLSNNSGQQIFSLNPVSSGAYRVQITAFGNNKAGYLLTRALDRTFRVAERGKGLRKKSDIDPFIRR